MVRYGILFYIYLLSRINVKTKKKTKSKKAPWI